MVVRDLTSSFVAYELPYLVRTGVLSPQLLRPAHPLLDIWGRVAATRVQRIMMLVPIVVLIGMEYDVRIASDWRALLAVALVIPLAIATRYLADSVVGNASFWLVHVEGA